MAYVIKANGIAESFSEEKLRNSIRRAGIPRELENQVLAHVVSRLYENIPTSEIYSHIIEFLGTSSRPYSKSKYSLKRSIMELGPTGYPFEDYFAEILKAQGFSAVTRQILPGKCISHEIDVIAEKENKKIAVEAKFHNMPGTKTDVHVALYTKARFDDIKEKNDITDIWLVTNTKISIDAISYANCAGFKVISWNYPENNSLRDMIEKSNLLPVTILNTLSAGQKQILLQRHIVLCKSLLNPESMMPLNLDENKKREVKNELHFLLNNGTEFSSQAVSPQIDAN